MDDLTRQRTEMVEYQIKRRGIKQPSTLESFIQVPRHLFVPPKFREMAYDDKPLPIGHGQTISQPFIVALMTEAAGLSATSRVLEIGTGSGYQAAILSQIAFEIYTVERIPELAQASIQLFDELGYQNIEVKIGDGSLGWQEKSPFDAILVTAGAPVLPSSLIEQLNVGGYLVIPVGDHYSQRLLRFHKTADGSIHEEYLEAVRFVPLIGKEGWENS